MLPPAPPAGRGACGRSCRSTRSRVLPRPTVWVMLPLTRLLAVALAALLVGACGGEDDRSADRAGHGLEHVHGLGVNPADGELYVATHYGIFRSPEGSREAERVGDGLQDTMGFTIAGPDHFLASGHPGPGEAGPANLGLIESRDAGETWREVSLGGEADFHALSYVDGRIYGYDATSGRLMLSADGGESWEERHPPGLVIDLAIDPEAPGRMLAATDRGLSISDDGGRSWRSVGPGGRIGLLAWPAAERLYLVGAEGQVLQSSDAGRRWEAVGRIGGQPAALVAEGPRELYVALGDGRILRSADGGASWRIRMEP